MGERLQSAAVAGGQRGARVVSWRAARPQPGWQGHDQFLQNPRPPAVPATLDLDLEGYYAACGAIGILAAQTRQPDLDWVVDQASKFGEKMARKIRKQRKR